MQTILLPQTDLNQKIREAAKQYVRTYFKDDYGNPFGMTDSQADMFNLVFAKPYDRNQIMAYTQHGKSTIIALAVIARSQDFQEEFTIVGGSQDKAEIIMEKVIQHIFDHQKWWSKLVIEHHMPLEVLRRTRSKENLMWIDGGGVRIRTGDSRNRQRVKEALTGFGSPNVICEEASLIPDDLMVMIMRMIGGHTSIAGENKAWILKVGNAIYRNHFHRSHLNSRYHNLVIPWEVGVKEGRVSEDFIEEMRDQPFFSELYECEFPAEDAVSEGGYRKIIIESDITSKWLPADTNIVQIAQGPSRLGVDVGRGGNRTVFCLRYDNVSQIIERNRDKDLMAQVGKIRRFMELYNVSPSRVFIDDVGVGGGITDRLREQGLAVQGIKEGGKATDERFKNIRAEIYWKAADWIKKGGQLIRHDGFMQMALINFKEDSSSRLQIEPKADLAKRGVESPDDADSFSLTFGPSSEFRAETDFAIV